MPHMFLFTFARLYVVDVGIVCVYIYMFVVYEGTPMSQSVWGNPVCVYIYICIYVCMHIYICTCIYIYICVCIYV